MLNGPLRFSSLYRVFCAMKKMLNDMLRFAPQSFFYAIRTIVYDIFYVFRVTISVFRVANSVTRVLCSVRSVVCGIHWENFFTKT